MLSKWDWIASSGKGAVAYSSQGAVHRDMGLWCHQLPNVNAGKIFCFWPHLWPRHYCGSAHTQHRHHSAYKLNKQDNIQPWCTPFLIWNQSVVPCPVLTCFLTCIKVSQEAGQVVWYSQLLEECSTVCCYSHKVFGVVNKAEEMFFCNSLAFSVI